MDKTFLRMHAVKRSHDPDNNMFIRTYLGTVRKKIKHAMSRCWLFPKKKNLVFPELLSNEVEVEHVIDTNRNNEELPINLKSGSRITHNLQIIFPYPK